jgi:hypothetical protein
MPRIRFIIIATAFGMQLYQQHLVVLCLKNITLSIIFVGRLGYLPALHTKGSFIILQQQNREVFLICHQRQKQRQKIVRVSFNIGLVLGIACHTKP